MTIDVNKIVQESISILKQGFEIQFMTSIKVIKEVMNVPSCAVRSILREQGVCTENIDEASICIDEKMLEKFADAYVRKLKNFFISSSRHISIISDKERNDLKEFYNLFKKQEVSNEQLGKWDDIDISLLRDSFYRKVRKLTWSVFRPLMLRDETKISKYRIPIMNFEEKDEIINMRRDKISSDILVYANNNYAIKIKQRPHYIFLSIHIGRHKMFTSARYYVFPSDDDHMN